jgi:hypothetical protein
MTCRSTFQLCCKSLQNGDFHEVCQAKPRCITRSSRPTSTQPFDECRNRNCCHFDGVVMRQSNSGSSGGSARRSRRGLLCCCYWSARTRQPRRGEARGRELEPLVPPQLDQPATNHKQNCMQYSAGGWHGHEVVAMKLDASLENHAHEDVTRHEVIPPELPDDFKGFWTQLSILEAFMRINA